MKVKYNLELEMEVDPKLYKTDGLPFSKETVDKIEKDEFCKSWSDYIRHNYQWMSIVKSSIRVIE